MIATGTVSEWTLHGFFQAQRRFEQRCRYGPGYGAPTKAQQRRLLGRQAERRACEILADRGWPVWHVASTEHNKRFDLYARGARVEVKASGYYLAAGRRGGRYQWQFHNQADLVLLAALNGRVHWFVIPAGEIGERENLAVWSYNPAKYAGQWAAFYEAWGLADDVIRQAGPVPVQLSLW